MALNDSNSSNDAIENLVDVASLTTKNHVLIRIEAAGRKFFVSNHGATIQLLEHKNTSFANIVLATIINNIIIIIIL